MNALIPASTTTAAGRIADAAAAVRTALESSDVPRADAAKTVLQHAVDDARDGGMTWGTIARVLDIRRGNAIKRYQQRSQPISPGAAPT